MCECGFENTSDSNFCQKCGKKLDYDGDLCEECRNRELVYGDEEKKAETETTSTTYDPFDEPPIGVNPASGYGNSAYVPDNGDRMHGFGKALTAAILSEVAVVFAYLGIYACILSVALGVFLILATIAMAVISLVFGIQSIKTFVADKNAGKVKPIATLVCGIAGVVAAAVALFVLVVVGSVVGIALGSGVTPVSAYID